MNKKIIFSVSILLIIVIIISLLTDVFDKKEETDKNKVQVIATLFPQYDFIKQIGKDKVNVEMLLPPGVESHSYEPTPIDMIKINSSDIFVYTGKEMEPWAETIASSIDSNTVILDVSKNIKLINPKDFEEKNENGAIVADEESEDLDTHESDPHIWLDPVIAGYMVDNILESLVSVDPVNETFYKSNAEEYKSNLLKLDEDIKNVITNGKRNTIVFGGAFAYAYFIERYDLNFISAYDSCGEGSEPSVARVKSVIDYIKENNIPVIFYQDMSAGSIAKTIAAESGAKELIFSALHNVSKVNIDNGVTYIDLMRQNLTNLEIALN